MRGKDCTEVDLTMMNGVLTEPGEQKSPNRHSRQTSVAQSEQVNVEAATAIVMIEDWIKTQFINAKITCANVVESTWWGDKFSGNIKNLGRAIGKNYSITKADSDGATKSVTIARYRIDWDKELGRHFNIYITTSLFKVTAKSKNGKYVFRFGQLDSDLVCSQSEEKDDKFDRLPVGEKAVIAASLVMTSQALQLKAAMPSDIAVMINRCVEMTNPDLYQYFLTFGALKEPLVAHAKTFMEIQQPKCQTEPVKTADIVEVHKKIVPVENKEVEKPKKENLTLIQRKIAAKIPVNTQSKEKSTVSTSVSEQQMEPVVRKKRWVGEKCPTMSGMFWMCSSSLFSLFYSGVNKNIPALKKSSAELFEDHRSTASPL